MCTIIWILNTYSFAATNMETSSSIGVLSVWAKLLSVSSKGSKNLYWFSIQLQGRDIPVQKHLSFLHAHMLCAMYTKDGCSLGLHVLPYVYRMHYY